MLLRQILESDTLPPFKLFRAFSIHFKNAGSFSRRYSNQSSSDPEPILRLSHSPQLFDPTLADLGRIVPQMIFDGTLHLRPDMSPATH